MKKQTVSQLTILLTLSSLIYACVDKSNKGIELTFDTVTRNETAHLFADTARPACNVNIRLEYIVKADHEQAKDSLNNYLLTVALGEQYSAMNPQEAVDLYIENYVSEYRKDCEPMYSKEMVDPNTSVGSWYSYYKTIKTTAPVTTPYLMVYRVDQEEYTGGAHGMHTGMFYNIQLQPRKLLKLDDLFVDDSNEALTEMLWNQLLVNIGVKTRQEAEDMGYVINGELEPTQNFYLDREGITFYYNVYEIAPYVMGAIEIHLPYTTVESLLKPNVIKQLGIE
ncbi:MAG: DUF3298 and DUF4163 domain-containing protein [Prevotellaceae bacterium]|nr:DUF3298 and DUF4163 domain-containing protein [Prevotellaceae bacterium]